MDLRPGLLVTRKVRLRRPLGEGGMGTVWIADHLALDMQVAVKFISPELSKDDPEILGRFQREARVAARIRSQHVVQVFDHGVMDDDTPFIVMELLNGSSLAEWLALTGTLTPDDAATMVGQVAGVLGKAHDLGIVHRDIKPENVFLVDSEDRLFAKVLDFGIAKQTDVPKDGMKTGTGVLIGTPDYMSPEQLLRAVEVDHRVDLWALAVVAYRALTGRCPFQGETVPAVIVAITDGAFPPPSSVARQRLSPAIDGWFARALSPNAATRFGTARELADSFAAAAGAAVRAGERGALERPNSPEAASEALARSPQAARESAPPATIGAPVARRGVDDSTTPRRPPVRPGRRRAARAPAAPVEDKGPEPRRVPPRRPTPEPPPEKAKPSAPAASAREVVRADRPRARRDSGGLATPQLSARVHDLGGPVRGPESQPRRPAVRPSDSLDVALMVAEFAPPAILVATAGAAAHMLDPSGMQWLTGSSPGQGVGLAVAAALLLGVGAWRTTVAAQRHEALSLWVASFGLAVLAIGSAVTAGALRGAGGGLASFLPLVSEFAPVAAAVVAAALGTFGIGRALFELRGHRSGRRARGAVMVLLSLAAVGLAYRVATRSPMIRDLLASQEIVPRSHPVEQVGKDLS